MITFWVRLYGSLQHPVVRLPQFLVGFFASFWCCAALVPSHTCIHSKSSKGVYSTPPLPAPQAGPQKAPMLRSLDSKLSTTRLTEPNRQTQNPGKQSTSHTSQDKRHEHTRQRTGNVTPAMLKFSGQD